MFVALAVDFICGFGLSCVLLVELFYSDVLVVADGWFVFLLGVMLTLCFVVLCF